MAKRANNVAAASTPPPPPKAYASAMDKLRDEMAENAGNRYIQVVGEYLTDYLLDHPEAEAAILAEGKSIKGSLSAMEAEARKVKVGSVAVLDDQTAFGIVRGYFGIVEGERRETSSAPASGGTFPRGEGTGETAEDLSKKAEYVSKKAEDLSKKAGDLSKKAENVAETQPDPVDPFDLDALLGGM